MFAGLRCLAQAPACRNNHWLPKEVTWRAGGPVLWETRRMDNTYPVYPTHALYDKNTKELREGVKVHQSPCKKGTRGRAEGENMLWNCCTSCGGCTGQCCYLDRSCAPGLGSLWLFELLFTAVCSWRRHGHR